MASYWKTVRRFSPSVRLYILANFGIGFSYAGISAVLYNLYLLRQGYSPELIGQLNGTGQLVWAAAALPVSALGMRFGLRNTLVTGSGVISASYFLLLIVESLPQAYQLSSLFAVTICLWLGAAMMTVSGLPYLSAVTQPEERGIALAFSNAMVAFAAVLGSLTAGFLPGLIAGLTGSSLDQALPYRLALLLNPFVYLISAILQSRMKREETVKIDSQSASSTPPPIGLFLFFGLLIFLQSASEGGLRAFFNIYLDQDLQVSTTSIGALFGLSGLVTISGALIMPFLVRRAGTKVAFWLVNAATAAILLLLGAVPHFLAAAAGYILFNVVSSVGAGVRGLLSQEIVQPRWRSTTSAILVLALALGWASMALLGSFVIGLYRFSGLMYISTGSAVLAVTLMLVYLRSNRYKIQIQPESLEIN